MSKQSPIASLEDAFWVAMGDGTVRFINFQTKDDGEETVKEEWAAIQAEALSTLSLEDLRILRDIVVKQAAGIPVEDTPLNHEVVQRGNEACDLAKANHARHAAKPQTLGRESYR